MRARARTYITYDAPREGVEKKANCEGSLENFGSFFGGPRGGGATIGTVLELTALMTSGGRRGGEKSRVCV